MITEYRYAISIISSYLICGLIVFFSVQANLFGLFIMLIPVLFLIISILFRFKRTEYVKVALFFLTIACAIIFIKQTTISDYVNIDDYSITSCVYLVLLTVFAAITPNIKPNSIFGIKIWITYEDDAIWEKTHRFCSVMLCGFLIPQFMLIFLLHGGFRFLLSNLFLILPLFLSVGYAFVIGLPIIKKKQKTENSELKEQIKREQGYR